VKLKTAIVAFLYGFVSLFLLPFFFVKLNNWLSLPIISFPKFRVIGVLFAIIGGALWFHSILLFRFSGEGTPVPTNSPNKLVTKGLYRYTRNPMYISALMVLLGYFFILGHALLLLNLIIMATYFHLFVVHYEEPTLKKKFEKNYTEYCKAVPRWLK